jgi:microcystin-dependent protein
MAGFITSWGGTTDIDGWMLCDGRSLLRGSYPELFASIGTAFGAADASHFNIPDYRGRFLRGVDGLAGNDPDSATRTAMNTGGNTGNNVGSVQLDELKGHSHAELYRVGLVQAGGSTAAHYMDAQSSTGVQTSVVGGSETRPKNAYTNFLIKLYNDRKNTVLSSSYVEYVSNTESTNNVSDLISFSSRLEGSRFPNIDNDLTPVNLIRRVNFSRPISISDKVYIQTDIGSGGVIWVDASQYFPYHADKNDDSDPAFKEYGLSMFPVPGQPAQLDIYFRQNGAQKNHTWQFYNSWRYRVVLTSNPLAVEMSNEDATGVIKMYGGDNAPSGWLVCNGEAISRTAFNKLFNVIGERFGSGDGSTTFNLPESRGLFPRGSLFPTISGGTLGGTITLVDTVNEILTIPNHGFNHTGIPVKFSGSLPTGISAGVVYYVIYLTQHTIAIAGTRAAALIDSRVNLSSATTGGICTQDLDPDYASREASSTGGSTGLGSFQDDAFRSHTHQFQEALNRTFGGGTNVSFGGGSTPLFTTLTTAASGGSETRPKNFMVNFIIKY